MIARIGKWIAGIVAGLIAVAAVGLNILPLPSPQLAGGASKNDACVDCLTDKTFQFHYQTGPMGRRSFSGSPSS